jgi:hypothetical protein
VPAFEVWSTPVGHADYNNLRADIRREVDVAIKALERRGCTAADYRLAGSESDLGRICVIQLSRDWRLILGFPAADEVAVLLIGRHLRAARSVYERLYRLLGVDAPTEERKKPACCTDGEPPTSPQLLERIVENAKALRRG